MKDLIVTLGQGAFDDDHGLSLASLGCKPQFRMDLVEDTTRITRKILEELGEA